MFVKVFRCVKQKEKGADNHKDRIDPEREQGGATEKKSDREKLFHAVATLYYCKLYNVLNVFSIPFSIFSTGESSTIFPSFNIIIRSASFGI